MDNPYWCVLYVVQNQFHNLSDCVLCYLPLFLTVTNSSRKLPLTPFEATSCRKTWQGVCSLKGTRLRATHGHNLSDSGSLTMTGWAGVSLGGSVSVEASDVKSKLDLAAFVSVGPRSIGWSILVRLMVLWLLNGREGWSLSQSARRQCNGKKKRMCVCTEEHVSLHVCVL